ncbi:MAG: hypothetical protein WC829_02395 [Hyphomicrobium sp.]
MAKITISIEGSTVGTITITDTLEQAQSDRFMAWLVSAYGTNPEGEPRNPAEMVEACWGAMRSGIFANIVSFEAEVVALAARKGVQQMTSQTAVGYKPAP